MFLGFVVKVCELGVLICVVSDGFDYVIYKIFGCYGLDDLLLVVNYLVLGMLL